MLCYGKGKHFGHKVNLLPSLNQNMPIFLVFSFQNWLNLQDILQKDTRRCWKMFDLWHIIAKTCCKFFNVLYRLGKNIWNWKNKRENNKGIHPKQVKWSWIIDKASSILSYWISSLFSRWIYSSHLQWGLLARIFTLWSFLNDTLISNSNTIPK